MIGTLSNLPFPEQRGTLNGTSSRNLLLASPGGKLPGLTALRNRQARLMRGGDRLVNDCIWMNGICFHFHHSTYYCGDFKRSPPLISLFYQPVPKCRLIKNPASPRGKPRRLRRSGRQVGDFYGETSHCYFCYFRRFQSRFLIRLPTEK